MTAASGGSGGGGVATVSAGTAGGGGTTTGPGSTASGAAAGVAGSTARAEGTTSAGGGGAGDDGSERYEPPRPLPLPMPEYGGYFAPLTEYLPDSSQPITAFHRLVSLRFLLYIAFILLSVPSQSFVHCPFPPHHHLPDLLFWPSGVTLP